jgi:ubiquinone/menaquinone biosynthesis C-methylase UbiE
MTPTTESKSLPTEPLASPSASPTAFPLGKDKPDWAGENWLSRFVNLLIRTKPIYAVMQQQARKVLIKTAETNGVAWRKVVEELDVPAVKANYETIANPTLTYPAYYQVPFHAYDEGNLCWLAAFEAEPATYAMALRIWKDEPLTWPVAQERMRHSCYAILDKNRAQSHSGPVQDLLDIGCSVGISTRSLRDYYAQRQDAAPRCVGLDLSPQMLAVAQHRDRQIQWLHALAESTGLAEASFDLVSLQFVCHELPNQATREIFQEALRLLRPGGHLMLIDNNPQSPVIQNLPPLLFTLMKSTEPWSDEYYPFDLEACLREVGFASVSMEPSDPRHRTIVARKAV